MIDSINLAAGSAPQGAFTMSAFWLRDVVLGSVASGIAVIAIAALGFAMLQGRIEARRAMRVVLGCFVLFGASAIASGLIGLAGGVGAGTAPEVQVIAGPPPMPKFTPPSPRDPYAGASVPN